MRKNTLFVVLISLLASTSAFAGVIWDINVDQTWYSDGCIVTYDHLTKTMTVSPDPTAENPGVMHDYDEHDEDMHNYNQKRPWHDVRSADEKQDNKAEHSFHNIEHVVVASGVTHIGNRAFNSFYGLKTLTIPDGVETIGEGAIQWLTSEHFTQITLPSTVTYIDGGNFGVCPNVTDLYMNSDPEDLVWEVSTYLDEFDEDKQRNVRCHVPTEYLDGYIAKWSTGVWVYDAEWEEWNTDDVNVTFAPIASEDEDPTDVIKPWEGRTTTFYLNRTLYKDGYYNTICLPFSLSAEQIAASPLAGCELFTFTSATKVSSTQLDLNITPVSSITAGVPYLVSWASGANITGRSKFENVFIPEGITAQTVGTGDVTFVGFFEPTHIDDDANHSCLFVGEENTLFWPIDNGNNMRGFRAYFNVTTGGSSGAPKKGTPARFVVQAPEVATGLDQQTDTAPAVKTIENGQLIILKNNIRYNAQGIELK